MKDIELKSGQEWTPNRPMMTYFSMGKNYTLNITPDDDHDSFYFSSSDTGNVHGVSPKWLQENFSLVISHDKLVMELSTAKVEDEYKTEYGDVFRLVSMNGNSICWSGYTEGDGPFYYVTDYKGVFQDSDDAPNLVSKHETRHWLKDLPDASYFELFNINYIHYSRGYKWLATGPGPTGFDRSLVLNQDKMPTPTGDEFKNRKVSIPDLKVWQEANK